MWQLQEQGYQSPGLQTVLNSGYEPIFFVHSELPLKSIRVLDITRKERQDS